jgi:hypothetical protein
MMTRKQFLRSLAGLAGAGAGLLVIGCNHGDGAPGPVADAAPAQPTDAPATMIDAPAAMVDAPPATTCAGTNATVGTNHGHAATIPAADITAGVEKTYDIKGTSGHPHTIKVTAAMFAMLKAGMPVMVTSSLDANHTHAVTISCA